MTPAARRRTFRIARCAEPNVAASRARYLLGGDLGCLLNMAGHLKRVGSPVRTYHVAEVLAGMADGRGIGDGDAEGPRR